MQKNRQTNLLLSQNKTLSAITNISTLIFLIHLLSLTLTDIFTNYILNYILVLFLFVQSVCFLLSILLLELAPTLIIKKQKLITPPI